MHESPSSDNNQSLSALPLPMAAPFAAHGVVERITYRNDDTGWTVLKIQARAGLITATGNLTQVSIGECFDFFGTWATHPQYGRQLKIERAVAARPTDPQGIIRFLGGGYIKGLGPKLAERIVGHFGRGTLAILDENPERLREVPKIGRKKAKTLTTVWREQRHVANVMLFLGQWGITPLLANRIYRTYGLETERIVSENPYQLARDVTGVGFLSADKIAQSMGVHPLSKHRLAAAISYQLEQGEERGHCYLEHEQIIELVTQALRPDDPEALKRLLPEILVEMTGRGDLLTDRDDNDQTIYYSGKLLAAELSVAAHIQRIQKARFHVDQARTAAWLQKYCQTAGIELSASQRQAVEKSLTEPVFILTGGPGVGKTTTANTMIRLFKAMGRDVVLAAPTGRAAQRLSEVAATAAKTIHRLLEWQPENSGFGKNEENPLQAGVVIIDEASMLDIQLASALVAAIPDNCQLILIGDVDQLPSVGPGNVLGDLIRSQSVATFHLREVFRQAQDSGIVRAAHAINAGEPPDFDHSRDCRMTEAEAPTDILKSIETFLRSHREYDPIRDVQVLTPMNKGELGTQQLNVMLQSLLNPNGKGVLQRDAFHLRAGDKVIQNANNYELGVFNGDIGIVMDTGVDRGSVIVNFAGRIVKYADEYAQDLRLAYAITIHKSQGSEFPVVLIPISMQHFIMLQRNLIYTALTRAKKLAVFFGTRKALGYAARNVKQNMRQTRLHRRLQPPGEQFQYVPDHQLD